MTGTIRLLYAEDNPFDADLTLRHFEREAPELHLEAVSSGKECLERLGKQTFDLLLLDYHLGDTDGIALLTSLRAAGNAVPVVMLTGAGDDSSIERALRAGADDYVVKSRIHLMSLPDRARSLIARLRDRASGQGLGTARVQRVLYVEPSPSDAEQTTRHLLNEAPHLRLHIVPSGLEALDLLKASHDYDLVLTELRGSGMDAFEFIHEARLRAMNVPFIVITGGGDEDKAVAILRLGATDYIVKRDNYLLQLPHAIDRALQRSRLDTTLRDLHAELESLNASLEEKVAARTTALMREVSERKKAEEALRRSEERLTLTLQSIGDGVIATNDAGQVRLLNPVAARMTGWTETEASGRLLSDVYRVVDAETRKAFTDPVKKVLERGEVVSRAGHTTLISRDGTECQITDTAAPIHDSTGQTGGIVLVFRDVTQEHRAQQARAANERQLTLITNAFPGPMTRTTPEGRYLFANAAFERIVGRPVKEIIGRTRAEVFGRNVNEQTESYVERAVAGERVTFEVTVPTAVDGLRHMLLTMLPDHDENGRILSVLSVATDITDRRNAEANVRRSEALLRIAGRTARLGAWAIDLSEARLTCSEEVCAILEVPVAEVPDLEKAMTMVPPEWHAPVNDAVRTCGRTGAPFDIEMELVTATGRRIWVRATGEGVGDTPRGVARVQGGLQDITERKESEQKIRVQLEELLRWQNVMLGRENRVQELKAEVNEILLSAGRPARYAGPG